TIALGEVRHALGVGDELLVGPLPHLHTAEARPSPRFDQCVKLLGRLPKKIRLNRNVGGNTHTIQYDAGRPTVRYLPNREGEVRFTGRTLSARALPFPRPLPRRSRRCRRHLPGNVPPSASVSGPIRPAAPLPAVAVHDRRQQGARPDALPSPSPDQSAPSHDQ